MIELLLGIIVGLVVADLVILFLGEGKSQWITLIIIESGIMAAEIGLAAINYVQGEDFWGNIAFAAIWLINVLLDATKL